MGLIVSLTSGIRVKVWQIMIPCIESLHRDVSRWHSEAMVVQVQLNYAKGAWLYGGDLNLRSLMEVSFRWGEHDNVVVTHTWGRKWLEFKCALVSHWLKEWLKIQLINSCFEILSKNMVSEYIYFVSLMSSLYLSNISLNYIRNSWWIMKGEYILEKSV